MKKENEEYYEKNIEYEEFMLEPYSARVMTKLFDMGLLPSLIKDKKKTFILNHIMCESHRDKLVFALKYNHRKI